MEAQRRRTAQQLRNAYDAEMKNILTNKRVLANILIGCTDEFANCNVEDVIAMSFNDNPAYGDTTLEENASNAEHLSADEPEKITNYGAAEENETCCRIRYAVRSSRSAYRRTHRTHRQRRRTTQREFALRPYASRHLLRGPTRDIAKRYRFQTRRLRRSQKSLFDLDLYESVARRSRNESALFDLQRRHHRRIRSRL